ncbi:bifunctional diaminohydroxyphosphoribosylaminopyrimidine deaminase/5-amino-6-(5-phosphoribosylamino)uracil reductase RibD [Bartonella apis]|uniref:bifunctional diaminohydroxyphosphoribosylaminopyrimidine deaminase/5-amino-6-(5-phosphoribosylamino)uracil reductase RibD n=1 Tax=Bartonella apis TaxID=1686310 RepID=UPI00242FBC3B|nr:bifunctional diaminohydroxyphosphoribosylaminopyrimidine deaminase/5-amino-6-(5-phosphoribosylamino)uracil reductase RibD [Bartonella apis]
MADDNTDRRFMAAAIRLAHRHIGETAENPSVGALIVSCDGKTIIGHGVTAIGGRPHAETQALQMAGENARGSTVYVTLEPCSHYGKTPPCANALIKAGVKRVVISLCDPDKRVSGRGIKMLEDAGIIVGTGLLADYAFEGLSAYLANRKLSRPEVTLKMAISADAGIGLSGKRNVSISNGISHSVSHIMRAENDAIMVGSNTVITDDPELDCRLPGLEKRSPVRVVVDRRLEIDVNCRVVETARLLPTWVIVGKHADQTKIAAFEKKGVNIFVLDDSKGLIAPKDILAVLFDNHISSILLEGGTRLACTFLDKQYVDKIVLFRSTIELGKNRIPAPDFEKYLGHFDKVNKARFGEDIYNEWRYHPQCLLE